VWHVLQIVLFCKETVTHHLTAVVEFDKISCKFFTCLEFMFVNGTAHVGGTSYFCHDEFEVEKTVQDIFVFVIACIVDVCTNDIL
jgi:hypothetical protein